MPAVRSSAPASVVHPCNHIHHDGKGQQAQQRRYLTVHRKINALPSTRYLCRLCSRQAMIFIATANRKRKVNVTNNVSILCLFTPSCDAVEPMRSDVQGKRGN